MAMQDAPQDETHLPAKETQEQTLPVAQSEQSLPAPATLELQTSTHLTEPPSEDMGSGESVSPSETPQLYQQATSEQPSIMAAASDEGDPTTIEEVDQVTSTVDPSFSNGIDLATPKEDDPAVPAVDPITSNEDDSITSDDVDLAVLTVDPVTPKEDDLASLPVAQPIAAAPPARRKRLGRSAKIALCLALVLLLGGGGLLYDLAYYQPNQAVATANAQATGTAGLAQTQAASLNATNTAQEQATAQVYQNIYQSATSGPPFLSDPLSHQSSAGWDEYNDPGQGESCAFKNGSYHVEQSQVGFFNTCTEDGGGFEDFALQIDISIVSGDYGGIIFRGHDGFFYFFEINFTGEYTLYLYNYKVSNAGKQIDSGSTGYMQTASSAQTNQITLVAEGQTFYFYMNQHFIQSFTDSSYTSGWIGLLAYSYQNPTDVAYSNEKIWLL